MNKMLMLQERKAKLAKNLICQELILEVAKKEYQKEWLQFSKDTHFIVSTYEPQTSLQERLIGNIYATISAMEITQEQIKETNTAIRYLMNGVEND